MLSVTRSMVVCLFVCLVRTASGVPAFPGAEGAGAHAAGGRGGSVYFVTNLNDSGEGSLRHGITSATGPRTILFTVSGTIDLQSDLRIATPFLTIAGQTAPGDGITLKRRLTSVENTHDVIVRYLRCRPGDADSTFENDAFHVVRSTDVMVDHVSASWSVDECLSVTHSDNITIQWCLISESLNNSQHSKGAHGYGSLLRYGDGGLSFHHNLFQHHRSRNPRLGDRLKLDFVNNVIYNWGSTAGYSGGNGPTEDAKDNPDGLFTNHMNYAGNYLVAGPSTTSRNRAFKGGATNTVIYQADNLIDSNLNSLLDGTDTGWSMFSTPYTASLDRYPLPAIASDPPAVAYHRVLAFGGASAVRDAVDERLLATVRSQTGGLVDAVGPGTQATAYVTNTLDGVDYVFVRGWPTLFSSHSPDDGDEDGIPDYWEQALGWNPDLANNNHLNLDGYTDLEWYLNWLAAPHAVGDGTLPVEVDLASLIGATNPYTFSVADATHGTVSLLGDGHRAHFVPEARFQGLASFRFSATPATGDGFGPVTVSLLISAVNTTNTPPTLDPIPDRAVVAGVTITFTNRATDADLPAQALSFGLADGPDGATLGTNDGVFTWRPTLAQGGRTQAMSVVVTDNGTPSLSSSRGFTVTVAHPVQPTAELSAVAGGTFGLIIRGDAGPDYTVQASTNLVDWDPLFTTTPPALPFGWNDPGAGEFDRRYYRVRIGP